MTTWQHATTANEDEDGEHGFVELLKHGHARSLVYRICKLPFGMGKSKDDLSDFIVKSKLQVSA